MNTHLEQFFSISPDLISLKVPITYDLYINYSIDKNKKKFLKIFPKGQIPSLKDLKDIKKKYHQIYILENQRQNHLQGFIDLKETDDVKKTNFLKKMAVTALDTIFNQKEEISHEFLAKTIDTSKESIVSIIEVIKDYNITKIQSLIGKLSCHDFYTYDHSINVAMYNISIFKLIKPQPSQGELLTIGLGGLLHDLGKIKTPSHLINQSKSLNSQEFDEVKQHPHNGFLLLNDATNLKLDKEIDLELIKRIVHEHHENFNGTGYPSGLKRDEIHLFSRITAISDFYDAITTKRTYDEPLNTEDALEVMKKTISKKIDPHIFKYFLQQINSTLLEGNRNIHIADNFDPCQPHASLPLIDECSNYILKENIFSDQTINKKNKC